MHLADLSVQKKEYQVAKFHAQEALEKYKTHGILDPLLHKDILSQLATIHTHTGEVQLASNYYEELIVIGERLTTLSEKAKTFYELAHAYQRQQQFEKASHYATLSISVFNELKDQTQYLSWRQKLILLQQSEANWQQSVESLREIATQYLFLPDQARAGETLTDAASILIDHNELDKAFELIEEASAYLSQQSPAAGKLQRLRADLSFASGHTEQGEKHLRNAIQIFEKYTMLSELRESVLTLCKRLNEGENSTEAFAQLERLDQLINRHLSNRGIAL
ncbi:hypothetical protein EV586_103462 [Tumebacillus sp. BK434]|uniref:tetratricopeptide repeat protein n=1 Tax=Tumebacillus sp. BK434 TaxID=2512169 RepID=UPI00104529D0|nr:hypothetical protein [Tumebacillus sp. BK434]TCP55807.1 hypothetical protein EV586_103462 [Tumebacillus sp. BK434]